MAHRSKERLDRLLVERGLAATRNRAQALIRAGEVRVDDQIFDKPGMVVPLEARIELKQPLPYVGRGGVKLAAALDQFGLDPTGLACIDVGASTGGFTDCLLQRGARRVYAIDVGRAQLAWSLRQDARVVNMERHDIRKVERLPESIALAVIDVAFISLTRVLPYVAPLLADDAQVIALIKPQFEAGRERVGKGGVIRDRLVHAEVLAGTLEWAESQGWRVRAAMASPLEGTRGNREFLAWLALASHIPGDAPELGTAESGAKLRVAQAMMAAGFPETPGGAAGC